MINRKRIVSIHIDADRCIGCWKCVEGCRHHVLTKIELPLQQAVVAEHAENCVGCLHCMNVCKNDAIKVIRFL